MLSHEFSNSLVTLDGSSIYFVENADIIACCCVLRNIAITSKEQPNCDVYQGLNRQDGEDPSELIHGNTCALIVMQEKRENRLLGSQDIIADLSSRMTTNSEGTSPDE